MTALTKRIVALPKHLGNLTVSDSELHDARDGAPCDRPAHAAPASYLVGNQTNALDAVGRGAVQYLAQATKIGPQRVCYLILHLHADHGSEVGS